MTPEVREWVAKADGDYRSALRELRARKDPNYDSACFHAQQCAEKYLKARLLAAEIAFPRIHDLAVLLNLLSPVHPDWESLKADAHKLTEYAVFFRYPGRTADKARAREAIQSCTLVRDKVRVGLGLPLDKPARRASPTKSPPRKARRRRK